MRNATFGLALSLFGVSLCAGPPCAAAPAVIDVETTASLDAVASLRSNAVRKFDAKQATPNFSFYKDVANASADLEGLKARADVEQTCNIARVGESVNVVASGSAELSCTRTGLPADDDRSGSDGHIRLDVLLRVSQRSRFTFNASTAALTDTRDGSSSAAVTLSAGSGPGEQSFNVEAGDFDGLPSRTAGSGGGVIEPGNYHLTVAMGATVVNEDQTSCRAFFTVSLSVSPAPVEAENGSELRWTKPTGGRFAAAANWDLERVPADDGALIQDTTIFDLRGVYTVDFASGKKALGPPQRADRIVVTNGSVTFASTNLTVDALSPDRPSVVVDRGRLAIAGGRLESNSALIGSTANADAEILVDGSDSTWNCLGRLRVGGSDQSGRVGKLTISNGAGVTSVDTRIGAGEAQSGLANISGPGSTWNTDNIHVGFSSRGQLDISDGAIVTSAIAQVGGGVESGGFDSGNLSDLSVFVTGVGSDGQSSQWEMATLSVGQRAAVGLNEGARVNAGSVEVLAGGFLSVSDGKRELARATLLACNSMKVDANGLLVVGHGGSVEIVAGNLGIGTGHDGTVRVFDRDPASGAPSSLSVDGTIGVGVGFGGVGVLAILDGATVTSTNGTVGASAGEYGEVRLAGARSSWTLDEGLIIGGDLTDDIGLTGTVTLRDGVVRASGAVAINPGGAIFGTGVVIAPRVDLDGVFSPSVVAGVPLEPLVPEKTVGPTPRLGRKLTIDGNLGVAPTGTVLIQVGGPEADQVVVTGNATYDGTLVLQFMNGYAPHATETFAVLDVGGTTTGAFAIDVRGLAPGALFDVAPSNGKLVATATNDTVALPTVSVTPVTKNLKEKSKKPVALRVARTGDKTQTLTVAYEVSGTAQNGVDCLLLSGTLTIPARKSSAKLLVRIRDDPFDESNETLAIRVLPGSAYTHSVASTAVLTIMDND